MDAIQELSILLNKVEHIIRQFEGVSRERLDSRRQEKALRLRSTYEEWYSACVAVLPDDLRPSFIGLFEGRPSYETSIKSDIEHLTSTDAQKSAHFLYFKSDLQEQQKILFLARRRLVSIKTSLPQEVRKGIAQICRKSRILSIDNLFVKSGCEPAWWIVSFTEHDLERISRVYGWLDGILLYAPDREREIIQTVCERLLGESQLSEQVRATIERYITIIYSPGLSLPAILSAYQIHPRVRQIAEPLITSGHFREAILNVYIALNDQIKDTTGRRDADGTDLMRQIFSPRNPILQFSSQQTEQQGHMELFAGAMMAIRNPRAHRLVEEKDINETIELLIFASLLFRLLDKAQQPTNPT